MLLKVLFLNGLRLLVAGGASFGTPIAFTLYQNQERLLNETDLKTTLDNAREFIMGLNLKSLAVASAAIIGTAVLGTSDASAARTRYYSQNGKRFKVVTTTQTKHITRYRYKTIFDRHGCKRRIRVPYRVCKRIDRCSTYCQEICFKRVRKCFRRRVRIVDDCGRVKYITKTYHRWVKVPVGHKWVFVGTSYKTRYA